MNEQLLKAVCDVPEIDEFINGMTPEKSRIIGAQLIKEQAERKGISEIEAMNELAPVWIATRNQALAANAKLAEHLTNLVKMCD